MSDAVPAGEEEMARILAELDGELGGALGELDAEPASDPEPLDASTARSASPAAVESFALGSDSFRPTERLTGLERMSEKIARALRAAIEPFAQARTQVAPKPLSVRRYDDWVQEQPFFVSLSHYRLRPLKGGMLVAIDPAFITALIERFYGGGSGAPPPRRIEFTASEELLLGRLLEKVVHILVEHWCEVVPVELALAQRETSSAHIGFVRADDPVVVQSFSIDPAGCNGTLLSVVYPLSMLRPIEEQMAMRVHDDGAAENDTWRTNLAAALANVTLPVRSVLARPEISLAKLMTLRPGDVIPIQLAQRTPLLIAQRAIAEGMIGEQDGRAALRIEKLGR